MCSLGVYLRELREEFSKGLILPKKDDSKEKPDGVSNITSGFNKKVNLMPIESTNVKPSSGKAPVGCQIDVKTITILETFQCQAKDLYDVLTKAELATVFTHSQAKVNASRGGEFVLFDGNITGKFEELIPNEKIVQSWRYKQWPAGHFSRVTIKLDQKVNRNVFFKFFALRQYIIIFCPTYAENMFSFMRLLRRIIPC